MGVHVCDLFEIVKKVFTVGPKTHDRVHASIAREIKNTNEFSGECLFFRKLQMVFDELNVSFEVCANQVASPYQFETNE